MIVLVLNYNDYETTETFVCSVIDYDTVEHIVVVDNKSTDDSFVKLKALEGEKVDVISSASNLGYGGGNNLGIRYIVSKYSPKRILLCNPDVIIEENVILSLDKFLENQKEYGIAAPFMLSSNGEKAFNTAFRVPRKWEYIFSIGLLTSKFVKSFYYPNITNAKDEFLDVGAVAGSLFMMDVEKMLEHGMYDENIFLYCEETVLSLKMQKANIKTALLPNLSFVHNHGVTINKSYSNPVKKQKVFLKSKLYVIKKYYDANLFEYSIAVIMKGISLLEVSVWNLLRTKKK